MKFLCVLAIYAIMDLENIAQNVVENGKNQDKSNGKIVNNLSDNKIKYLMTIVLFFCAFVYVSY